MLDKLATKPFQNPQGQGGTDWTLIASDRATCSSSPSPRWRWTRRTRRRSRTSSSRTTTCCTDIKESRDAIVTYQHRGTDVVEWRKAPHVAVRVGLNLIYGSDGNLGSPTNSPDGCTGSNDATNGATIVRNPGLANWVGTGDLSFIKSGILEAYADCFTPDGKAFSSTGVVRVNGLNLVPAQGEKITIDPATRKITSKQRVGLAAGGCRRDPALVGAQVGVDLPEGGGRAHRLGPRRPEGHRRRQDRRLEAQGLAEALARPGLHEPRGHARAAGALPGQAPGRRHGRVRRRPGQRRRRQGRPGRRQLQ